MSHRKLQRSVTKTPAHNTLRQDQDNQVALLAQVIVTNTIPTHPDRLFPELTVLSVANLLGETIWRVYNSSSVQSLL